MAGYLVVLVVLLEAMVLPQELDQPLGARLAAVMPPVRVEPVVVGAETPPATEDPAVADPLAAGLAGKEDVDVVGSLGLLMPPRGP